MGDPTLAPWHDRDPALLAWAMAKPAKPKFSAFIGNRQFKNVTLNRFLQVLEQSLSYLIAVVLLWWAMALLEYLGFKTYLLNVFESLLTAWVLIRLMSAFVSQAHWAKIAHESRSKNAPNPINK